MFSLPVTQQIIDAALNLKMISNYGVGYNNIDIEYARLKKIVVTNTPGPVTMPTAEHTLALMLALTRRILELDRNLRIGKVANWKVMNNLGNTLANKTLGIVGFGKIAIAVANLALAFD